MVFDKKKYMKEYNKNYREKHKEKCKKKKKEWSENNKEKIKEYNEKNKEKHRKKYKKKKKEWSENNKEKMKEWRENNKEYIKQHMKEYYKTAECKKSMTISSWKGVGLKLFGYTYEEVYEYYLSIDNCEVCNKDISMGGHSKHMDHCHSTGIFRWVLCSGCNNRDSWMNKI